MQSGGAVAVELDEVAAVAARNAVTETRRGVRERGAREALDGLSHGRPAAALRHGRSPIAS